MMKTKVTDTYPLTLMEAKNYLRVEHNEDDAFIETLVSASLDQITLECNRDFAPTTYTFTPISNSSGDIFLTSQEVDWVSTGSLKEVNGCYYTYLPEPYSGEITYGVATSGSFPNNVKVASAMLVSNWYENRLPQIIGTVSSPLAFAVDALLSPYKNIRP